MIQFGRPKKSYSAQDRPGFSYQVDAREVFNRPPLVGPGGSDRRNQLPSPAQPPTQYYPSYSDASGLPMPPPPPPAAAMFSSDAVSQAFDRHSVTSSSLLTTSVDGPAGASVVQPISFSQAEV